MLVSPAIQAVMIGIVSAASFSLGVAQWVVPKIEILVARSFARLRRRNFARGSHHRPDRLAPQKKSSSTTLN
jgi:hypothetical protein